MNGRLLAAAIGMLTVIGIAVAGGDAQATTAAGWDFSQYYIDGLTLQDPAGAAPASVASNYSGYDPTNGAGSFANTIGTATLSGGVLPMAGSLLANRSGAAESFGDLDYDSHVVLQSEGQASASFMSLSAGESAGTVEFEVDLAGASLPDGGGWNLSFGGAAIGGTSVVEVEFSTNCAGWSSYGTVTLDDELETEDSFSVLLDPVVSGVGCVRLSLDPSSGTGGRPVIDNVTIAVPEPGMAAGLVTGLAGLIALGSRRRSM